MSDFSTELRQRVAQAQRSLVEARENGDDYLVRMTLGDIESLARLAAENHVQVDGVEESLSAHGLSGPQTGQHRVIDLTGSRSDVSPG